MDDKRLMIQGRVEALLRDLELDIASILKRTRDDITKKMIETQEDFISYNNLISNMDKKQWK